MSFEDIIKQMSEIQKRGGSWCIHCGIIFDSVIDGRKHDLAEHYDYVLAQCNNDLNLLKDWANSITVYFNRSES